VDAVGPVEQFHRQRDDRLRRVHFVHVEPAPRDRRAGINTFALTGRWRFTLSRRSYRPQIVVSETVRALVVRERVRVARALAQVPAVRVAAQLHAHVVRLRVVGHGPMRAVRDPRLTGRVHRVQARATESL